MALPRNEQGPQRLGSVLLFDNLHLENSFEDNGSQDNECLTCAVSLGAAADTARQRSNGQVCSPPARPRRYCDGQVLCALINAIRLGAIPKINESTPAFKQMENIIFFLNAAMNMGVPESSLFNTADLHEQLDLQDPSDEVLGSSIGLVFFSCSRALIRNGH